MSIRGSESVFKVVFIAAFLFIAYSTNTSPQAPIPDPVIQAEPTAVDKMAQHCMVTGAYVRKWADYLNLKDWEISLFCSNSAPWEDEKNTNLRGSSMTFPEQKKAGIWISPIDPNKEHVVIHELLHSVLTYATKAQSSLVEENTVKILADLLAAYDHLYSQGRTDKRVIKDVEERLKQPVQRPN